MNDINGSADYGNMADYCIAVDRDDDLKAVTIYVDKVKFKHLGSRGNCTLHYDKVSGRYVPCKLDRVSRSEGDMLELGPHPTLQGVTVVKSDTDTKYLKTVDWSYFNIRWVDMEGNSILAERLAAAIDGQATMFN